MFGRFSVGYGCGDDDLVNGFCKVSTHGLYSGTTETFKYYISIVLTRLSVLYIAKKKWCIPKLGLVVIEDVCSDALTTVLGKQAIAN